MEELIMRRIVYQQTISVIEYELFDSIETHDQYKDLRNDLNNAQEGDKIIIKINSPGGNVDVGMMIVKAIIDSKATTIARVVWPSASMSAIIALACDGMIMEEFSELMFHSYAGGYDGKSHELLGTIASWHKHLSGSFNKIIGKFLTKSELKRMWNGEEIRIAWDDADLKDRINRHFNIKMEN